MPLFTAIFLLTFIAISCTSASPSMYHAIRFIDDSTTRGIPLVSITTTYKTKYYSDSNGYIAFFEPGLMDTMVFFEVSSSGYMTTTESQTIRLNTTSGGETVVRMHRLQVAERLFRLTGFGIYRDSHLLGKDVPVMHPLLQNSVTGLDSVMGAIYRDQFYWFFGDTNRVDNLLGNFFATAAVSNLTEVNFSERKVNLRYITDDNHASFVKPVAHIEPGNQPTWIHDVVVVPDDSNKETMWCTFLKPEANGHPELRGIMKWNDDEQAFSLVKLISENDNVWPVDGGHALVTKDAIYFGQPLPFVRTTNVSAEGYLSFDQYETYSPLKEGTNVYEKDLRKNEFERDHEGNLVWGWKRNTGYVSANLAHKLVQQSVLRAEDGHEWMLVDADSGKPVIPHGGTVYWNAFRNKYVMIFVQMMGESSFLGEMWYAESDNIVGSWKYTRHIATHHEQDYYNPRHMHEFDEEGGRVIHYMATYVATFSGKVPTPYYDYNNQVHRLDLSDERIVGLPQPVYAVEIGGIVFYSMERPIKDEQFTVAFYALKTKVLPPAGFHLLPVSQNSDGRLFVGEENLIFYGLLAEEEEATNSALAPLTELRRGGGLQYTTQSVMLANASITPLCLVYKAKE